MKTDPSRKPLPAGLESDQHFALVDNTFVLGSEFRAEVASIAARLPQASKFVNLCESRFGFLTTFCAALSRGSTTLLPHSSSREVVAELIDANPGCSAVDDSALGIMASSLPLFENVISPDFIVAVGHTSGTTGVPTAHEKSWASLQTTTSLNAAAIRALLDGTCREVTPWILATVPPQHMYGFEMSILLPLLAGFRVHCGKPLLPADVAAALVAMPNPRVLVSTPIHLRSLVGSSVDFPEISVVVSATAPLSQELAQDVEERMGGPLIEMFGSTETCVVATRRTAQESGWRPYREIKLEGTGRGTMVRAPWLSQDQLLHDRIDLQPDGTFIVAGRSGDIIEVGGKRASLSDLTRRMMSLDGVHDAIIFQPPPQPGVVSRCAAIVVAPGLSAKEVVDRMRPLVDAVFLPRPIVIVPKLPRNEVGKLPREKLLELLATSASRPRRET